MLQFSVHAQSDTIPSKSEPDTTSDTTQRQSLDEYLKTRKGIFGKMTKNLTRDTTDVQKANNLKRNDVPYKAFEGAVIRHITIKDLPFGIAISDTSKETANLFTRAANALHHTTRSTVIRNNLFFRENELLKPLLMADNETYLRQLPYVQDAVIEVVPADELSLDSVDVHVAVKDLFSLGFAISSLTFTRTDIAIIENNIAGSGNALVVNGLYDNRRRENFGAGFGYVLRNIGGSFITFNVGYQSYNPSIVGLKEENLYYARLIKPLVNRYERWTYEIDGSYHSTRNMYSTDSIYYSDIRYRYYNFDGWVGYNLHATRYSTEAEERILRKLIAVRILDKQFQETPLKNIIQYDYRYADIAGIMASLSFYRQNFYETQFIYAFGINEDVPEGLDLSVTAGYTKKESLSRPFIGFDYERSGFNRKNNYFSYALRAEGYINHKRPEDINLFGVVNYFDHLKAIGTKWKQRTFVDISMARQINTVLNEPLRIDSKYALPAFRIGDIGGSFRTTVRAQSVFYSPWNVESFRFAPLIFSDAGVFTPYDTHLNTSIYTLFGGGIITRNENLIFGTLQLRGYYFLQKNMHHQNWRFDAGTNITFRYNKQVAVKPDFIQVN